MSASDPLVEFIRARLDEDEQDAWSTTPVPLAGQWKAAQAKHPRSEDEPISIVQGRDEHQPDYEGYSSGNPVIVTGAGWPDEPDNEANLRHIARHDPARVLRGVEAKRQAIELWESNWEWSQNPACPSNQRDHYRYMAMGMRDMLVAMAGEWERHADYRDGWKS